MYVDLLPVVKCVQTAHLCVVDQLRQATTKSSLLGLLREEYSCSAVKCHVLSTSVCVISTACHGAWQHLHSPRCFVLFLGSLPSPGSSEKQKTNLQYVCFIILALLGFCLNCQLNFTFLVWKYQCLQIIPTSRFVASFKQKAIRAFCHLPFRTGSLNVIFMAAKITINVIFGDEIYPASNFSCRK